MSEDFKMGIIVLGLFAFGFWVGVQFTFIAFNEGWVHFVLNK